MRSNVKIYLARNNLLQTDETNVRPNLEFPFCNGKISSLCTESAAESIDSGRGQGVPIGQYLDQIGQYFKLVNIWLKLVNVWLKLVNISNWSIFGSNWSIFGLNWSIFQIGQYFKLVNISNWSIFG